MIGPASGTALASSSDREAPDGWDLAVPRFAPPAEGGDRPFWSVMIPAYNAGNYLEQTLRSVLDQDPGSDRMEIVVVDDASPEADRGEEIVRRLAPGRVVFRRSAENLGLAGNWNRCIAQSRGRWVHLLHQDDWVLPGFYEGMARADSEAPGAGAAYCRHVFADWDGQWNSLSELVRREAGIAEDLLEKLSQIQCIQCASIVVKRSTYEAIGGYRGDLRYTLDWEMCSRIASRYPVWYDPRLLACYRWHDESETESLNRSSVLLPDILRVIPMIRRTLPESLRGDVGRGQLNWLRWKFQVESERALALGETRAALACLRSAMACDRPHGWSLDLRRKSLRVLKRAASERLGLSTRPSKGRVPSSSGEASR